MKITANWGGGAQSSIRISKKKWRQIEAGESLTEFGTSWYEGGRESVCWSFKDATLTIDGEEGRQCVVEEPISSLVVEP